MLVLDLLLYIIAATCFLLFSLNVATKWHLLGLGVFFWSLVPLIDTINKL